MSKRCLCGARWCGICSGDARDPCNDHLLRSIFFWAVGRCICTSIAAFHEADMLTAVAALILARQGFAVRLGEETNRAQVPASRPSEIYQISRVWAVTLMATPSSVATRSTLVNSTPVGGVAEDSDPITDFVAASPDSSGDRAHPAPRCRCYGSGKQNKSYSSSRHRSGPRWPVQTSPAS
jgi:hypothetical protein